MHSGLNHVGKSSYISSLIHYPQVSFSNDLHHVSSIVARDSFLDFLRPLNTFCFITLVRKQIALMRENGLDPITKGIKGQEWL